MKKRLAYQKLRDKIYSHIKTRGLQRGDLLPSICALAKEWNTNYGTMKTAYKLLENEGIINYQSRRGAVVSHDLDSPKKTAMCYIRWQGDAFCFELNKGIKRYADENDIELIVIDAMHSDKRFLDILRHPPESVQGMVVVPESEDRYEEAVNSAISQDLQIVFLDRIIPGMQVSSVCSDHFSTAYLATDHLLEHHDIPVNYLGSTQLLSSTRYWVEGWSAAMNKHNFSDFMPYLFDLDKISKDLERRRLSHQEILIEAAGLIFDSSKQDIYSIFAGNNYIARAVYFAAEERGLEIGRDVFVVGTGDAPRCDNLKVPLTSVWQNTEQVGYEGANLLHQHIEGKIKHPVHRLMPVKLVCRESSLGMAEDQDAIELAG